MKRALAFAAGAALRCHGTTAFSPINTGPLMRSEPSSSNEAPIKTATSCIWQSPLMRIKPLQSSSSNEAVAGDQSEIFENEPLFSQTPEEVFAELISSTERTTIGLDDLERWTELRELVEDEMILQTEVEAFYRAAVSGQDANEMDAMTFAKFYAFIDDLFEDDVDETQESSAPEDSNANAGDSSATVSLDDLLSVISAIDDEPLTVLPCGLDCKDSTRDEISQLIAQLRQSDTNLVKTNGGVVEVKSLLGTWSLLYTSSLTMIINKSLSGLGRSTSDTANFSGLTQTLSGTKYFGECRFVETIAAGDEEGTSIEVVVDGGWELKDGADPDTGERVTILKADPITLEYPGNKAKADDWSSLGSVKFLDIICLIDDILILRGITLTGEESLFVWKKVS